MKLYKFLKRVGFGGAISNIKSGVNIPNIETYVYFGTIHVDKDDGPRFGANSADIIAAINEQGYYLSEDTGFNLDADTPAAKSSG
jgi:hypothetical protein